MKRLSTSWLAWLLAGAAVAQTSVLELQPGRRSEHVELAEGGTLELTTPNPAVGGWVLLSVAAAGAPRQTFHLETAAAGGRIALDRTAPGTLTIEASGSTTRCPLWPGDALARARRMPLAYAPLCDGQLYLRNAVRGHRSALEATTQFLRDHVWRGEELVGFVRREVYADAWLERGGPAASAPAPPVDPTAPPEAVYRAADGAAVVPTGLALDTGTRGALRVGRWYPLRDAEGVWVSVARPAAFTTRPSDATEAAALAYLVAFDLGRFDLGFALGTDHPRVGWSPRVPAAARDARPGPDGFATVEPFVRTGQLAPSLRPRIAAVFTGGFKREHGAFRYGKFAAVENGSHYGFVEHGVVFSRLVPGLATLFVDIDGTVRMKTWDAADGRRLAEVRDARQNGVPLVEQGAPGALVDQWGPGNWSGSADARLRTLRAGACIVDGAAGSGRRFLVYGWFSSTTPRTMAEVFVGYRCSYAMHLDMNALEHTYLAVFVRAGDRIEIEHLVAGMAALDPRTDAGVLPRFVGVPDDRDFVYLVRPEKR
jgi:hypothetical protein